MNELTRDWDLYGFRVQRSLHGGNPFPWAGRYGGLRAGEIFQRLDFGGRFGDILVLPAGKPGRGGV